MHRLTGIRICVHQGGISISLGQKAQPGPAASAKHTNTSSNSAAAALLGDDEEEEEDMPPEARMRMRNVGKNTPTSSGPNSFSKSQGGFTDNNKTWEKTQEKLAQDVGLELASKKPLEPKIKMDTFKKAFEKKASDSE
eukprot:comp21812_c0_seq2/m.31073 comp21812_c0_seq2/g.31073  ORF comp21812_c0_seq2/g.31073 comp21812_c0_seq2/m.31073 type:complete len:138 (-) comp21812_c0_seq2:256-669(-)